MRQSGVLAAAGLVALQQNVTRLDADHINARQLAAGLGRLPGIQCEVPETNIVLIRSQVGPNGQRVGPCLDALMDAMEARGVRLGYGYDSSVIRAVTHLGITCEDVATVVTRFRDVLPTLPPPPAALGPALNAAGCEHDVVLCPGLQMQRRQGNEGRKDANGCFVLLVKITFKTGAKNCGAACNTIVSASLLDPATRQHLLPAPPPLCVRALVLKLWTRYFAQSRLRDACIACRWAGKISATVDRACRTLPSQRAQYANV